MSNKTRKTLVTLLIAAIILIVIGILAFSVWPMNTATAQRGIDLSFFTRLDQWLPLMLGKQITGLLAMIVVQVLLAVALAVRQKVFEWRLLADFYRTRVVPMLIGWLAFVVLVKFATSELLGPTYGGLAGDGVSWAAWLAVVASLGARIVEDARSLYGELLPFKALSERSEK